jgi:hypothetical protein
MITEHILVVKTKITVCKKNLTIVRGGRKIYRIRRQGSGTEGQIRAGDYMVGVRRG